MGTGSPKNIYHTQKVNYWKMFQLFTILMTKCQSIKSYQKYSWTEHTLFWNILHNIYSSSDAIVKLQFYEFSWIWQLRFIVPFQYCEVKERVNIYSLLKLTLSCMIILEGKNRFNFWKILLLQHGNSLCINWWKILQFWWWDDNLCSADVLSINKDDIILNFF